VPVRHIDRSGSLSDLLAARGLARGRSAARLSAVGLPGTCSRRNYADGLGFWLLVFETVIMPAGRLVLYTEGCHGGAVFLSASCAAKPATRVKPLTSAAAMPARRGARRVGGPAGCRSGARTSVLVPLRPGPGPRSAAG
jgi:hypothetical protein